jgi:hypothetical protein
VVPLRVARVESWSHVPEGVDHFQACGAVGGDQGGEGGHEDEAQPRLDEQGRDPGGHDPQGGVGRVAGRCPGGTGGVEDEGDDLRQDHADGGAEVTMLSRSPGKKADAQKLGAHDFVLTTGEGALARLANRFDAIVAGV